MSARHRPGHEEDDLQHQAEHTRPRRRGSVVGYLSVLFVAAFLLLLVAYFQQQRQNAETADALRQSVSAVDTIQNMMADNETLRQENASLRDLVQDLGDQVDQLDSQRLVQDSRMADLEDQLAALDYLWRIQRFYSRGAYDDAKALTDRFEATGLPLCLPRESPSGTEGATPLEQYNALLDAMDYREAP